MRRRTPALLASIAGALLLAGCGKPKTAGNSLDAMDNALINGAVSAEHNDLAGAIEVDPAKLHARRQERPATSSLAELAHRQAARKDATPAGEGSVDGTGIDPAIAEGLTYSNDWAKKLPADLPMMAGGLLQEAAGRDGAPLTMRVVSFTAPGDRSAVLAWYAQKARAAGYTAERGQKDDCLLLEGEKPGAAAYVVMVGATVGGRTPVDYIWTQG